MSVVFRQNHSMKPHSNTGLGQAKLANLCYWSFSGKANKNGQNRNDGTVGAKQGYYLSSVLLALSYPLLA